MDLDGDLLALLRGASTCYLATTMPDGSPQLTQVWVDEDAGDVLINAVDGSQKLRNIARDPRVALTVADPASPSAYTGVRGRVVSTTTDGAREHIDRLSQKYLGRPYPVFGGREQQRVIVRVRPERVHRPRG